MIHNKLFLGISAAAMMLATACNSDPVEPVNPEPGNEPIEADVDIVKSDIAKPAKNNKFTAIELTREQQTTLAKVNDFSWRVYNELLDTECDAKDNQVVSPLSITYALAMLSNGADGNTLDELLSTLSGNGEPMTVAQLNSLCETIVPALYAADNKCSVNVANGVWYDPSLQIRGSFLNSLRQTYWAEWQEMDFSNAEEVLASINSWAERETEGRIKNVKQSLMPDENIILANALSFVGEWSNDNKFDEEMTKRAPFTTPKGLQVSAKMMVTGREDTEYAETDTYQAAELLYGNGAYRMMFIMPKGGETLSGLRKNLDYESLMACMQTGYEVMFYVPRFEIEQKEYMLRNALENMGCASIFDMSAADYSLLSWCKPTITSARHYATITVNERGAEAASVTIIDGATADIDVPQKVATLKLDRPFMYLIREASTGAILFMGQVTDPTKK